MSATSASAHQIATGANFASEAAATAAAAALELVTSAEARIKRLEDRPADGTDHDARQGLVEALRREAELRNIVATQEIRIANIEKLLVALKMNLGAGT
jgi:hypothetical protein